MISRLDRYCNSLKSTSIYTPWSRGALHVSCYRSKNKQELCSGLRPIHTVSLTIHVALRSSIRKTCSITASTGELHLIVKNCSQQNVHLNSDWAMKALGAANNRSNLITRVGSLNFGHFFWLQKAECELNSILPLH